MDFDTLTREELIALLKQNTAKKGLAFKTVEDAALDVLRRKLPFFVNDTNRNVIRDLDAPTNLLIEGENLFALMCLVQCKRRKIDFIYLDPPYNTGHNDFVYNDKFIDETDGYRHSKWLTFMRHRLLLAHELLAEDGMIALSIDDHEYAELKLLCDEIFGAGNFIDVIIWTTNPSGKTDSEFLAKKHEYVLLYAFNITKLKFNKSAQKLTGFNQIDENGRYYKWDDLSHKLTYGRALDYAIQAPDGSMIYAGYVDEEKWKKRTENKAKRKDYVWRWSQAKFNTALASGDILFKKNKDGAWRVYLKTLALFDEKTGFDTGKSAFSASYDLETSKDGQAQLSAILDDNTKFSYPKPTGLIKYLLNLKATKKDMTVLDFFAGSGTTGQAVLELNVINGTKHRFILCTNNENGICDDVCYPRLKTLLTGQKPDGAAYQTGFRDFISRAELKLVDGKVKRFTEIKKYDYNSADYNCNLMYYRLNLVDASLNPLVNIKAYADDVTLNTVKFDAYFPVANPLFTRYDGEDVILLFTKRLLNQAQLAEISKIAEATTKKLAVVAYYQGNKIPWANTEQIKYFSTAEEFYHTYFYTLQNNYQGD